jgi:hypothetical protein
VPPSFTDAGALGSTTMTGASLARPCPAGAWARAGTSRSDDTEATATPPSATAATRMDGDDQRKFTGGLLARILARDHPD